MCDTRLDSDNVRAHLTILDVAEAAGVSAMTVSRVLNGVAGASAATRAKVMREVERLGYRPNALAKGLKERSSGTVAMLVPDITNPFFPEIIRGAEDLAQAEGFSLLLCNVVENPDREADLLGMLEGKRVDGVIVCSARLPDQALFTRIARHGAAVLVNRQAPHTLAGTIQIDYRSGARHAVRHLVAQGRRRIGIIAGPATSRGGAERVEGARAALTEAGLSVAGLWHSSPDVEGGRRVLETEAAAVRALDAVICYNDLVAAGVLMSAKAQGVRVPDDLAVIGFDDIPLASMLTPALTSVRVDKYAIGRAAMRMLLDRRAGLGVQHGIVVEPHLVVRDSG
jgi:LacI family transcriptional regulator